MNEKKFNDYTEADTAIADQYVSFLLNNEVYAIEVLRVKEIVGMTAIRTVPNSVKHLKGLMNLRGAVVPVIDLRLKFNMPEKEYDSFNVILIIEINNYTAGIIVDSVSDVITSSGPISDASNLKVKIDREMIKGILTSGRYLIIILNPDAMLTGMDVETLSEL